MAKRSQNRASSASLLDRNAQEHRRGLQHPRVTEQAYTHIHMSPAGARSRRLPFGTAQPAFLRHAHERGLGCGVRQAAALRRVVEIADR
jgi:hypothetical protein